jgi:alkanesulfonate monooxygenase SsuD/methylene tetrahydromethanopterin reductase-like flavin-dependent oxidoreductase (luciferase family)
MEFGIFHEFPRRAGQSEAAAFGEGFALVDAAERWGLDVLWLAELHLTTQSVLASPLALASAVAARTERVKIGTAVQVLPLGDPLRLAEEWATVDQISRGRLIFGVGRSGFARTYQAYGIPYAESRERFAETLEIIRRAWSEPTFSYQGAFHRYEGVSLTPRPYQRPHPPIRVAAVTPDTFPQLGTQGYPLFAAVRQGTLSELAADLARYRAAYREAGHPGAGEVYLRIPIYVGETMERALAEPEESMMRFYREMATQLAESAIQAGARASDQRAERAEALANLTYDQARREKVIVGTPETVARRLQEVRDELGLQGILAELNCGRQIPHQGVMRSLQLLCAEVMPHFR